MSFWPLFKPLIFFIFGLLPASFLKSGLRVLWPFDYLLGSIFPSEFVRRARMAAVYYNCGLLSQSAFHYKKLLADKRFIQLFSGNSTTLRAFIESGLQKEVVAALLKLADRESEAIPNICWTLFQMGEFDCCRKLLSRCPQYTSPDCYYGPQLKFLNIVPISREFPELQDREPILPATQTRFFSPKVFGEPSGKEEFTLKIPDLELFRLKNVAVIGADNLVQNERLLVVDPANNPASGFVAGSWLFVTGSIRDSHRAMVRFPFEKKREIPRAFLLNGRCSSNYFHFLIEYLPRFFALKKSKTNYEELPILMDPGLPHQYFELLDLVLGKDHPIVFTSQTYALTVGELLVPSFMTYLPDSREIPFWKGGGFSKTCLNFIRHEVEKKLRKDFSVPHDKRSRKIFLSRSNISNRVVINQKAIEKEFQQKGYELVFPEKLLFREQVELFSSASHIAGPLGAAFANLIFCRPKTKVLGLIGAQNADWVLPANLAAAHNAEFQYLTGKSVKPRVVCQSEADFVHAPFKISLGKVKAFLGQSDF